MSVMPTPALDSTEIDDVSTLPGLRTRRGRFVYHGETVVLAGAGTVSFATPALGVDIGAWRRALDDLAALQSQTVRFRIRFNPWAFCFGDDRAVPGPWPRTSDGYLLQAFDGRFWDLARAVVQLAHERGIVIHYVLFDGRALDLGREGGWQRHPFARKNGGPIATASTPAFYNLAEPRDMEMHRSAPSDDWEAGRTTQCCQQRYVAHAIGALSGLDNVAWGIVSEIDGADPARVGFVQHFIEFMRRHDPMDRLVSCSGRNPMRSDSVYYHLTGIDTVQFHLDVPESQRRAPVLQAVKSLRRFGKPVMLDTVRWPRGDPRTPVRQRTAFWRALVSGGHASLHEGAWPEQLGEAAWLRAYVSIVSGIDVVSLYPAPSLVSSAAPSIWPEAALGPREGVAYFVADQPMGETKVSLALPDGEWELAWTDPASGRLLTQSVEQGGRTGLEITAPAFECDLLLILRRPIAGSHKTN